MAFGTGFKHLIREAATWTLVFGAGFGAVYYFDDLMAAVQHTSSAVRQTHEVQVQAPAEPQPSAARSVHLRSNAHGHFAVEAYINGRPVDLMADTGATLVALTYEEARRIGFTPNDLEFSARTHTANGVARVAPVILDRVEVGDIMVRDVRAMVAEPGRLHVNLLGMSFIGRLKSFEMRGGELVLNQ